MTTKEMVRCKRCPFLQEDANGHLVCTEVQEEIDLIRDEECPLDENY